MASRLLDEFLNFTEIDNATALDCIVPNCTGLCLYDACLEPPPPMVSVTPIHLRRPDRLLPTLLITAAALFAFAFLLVLSLYLFLHRRRSLRLRRRSHQNPQNPADGADDPFDEEGGDFADHPVWYIRTVGLEESTIRSIAAWVYKADDGLVDGSDCSVCLGEFADGELVRLLPKCSHAFHLSCIDTWLRSHVNCPLCRAPILSPAAATSPAVDPPPADVAPESDASDDDSETTQIAIQPEEMDHEEEEESESGVGIKSLAGSSSELPEELVEDGLQPVRRSVSMDAFSLGKLLVGVGPEEMPGEEEAEEGRVVKKLGKVGRVSKAGFLVQKDPLGMERSLSSRSGRYLFGRGRRNSVLPL